MRKGGRKRQTEVGEGRWVGIRERRKERPEKIVRGRFCISSQQNFNDKVIQNCFQVTASDYQMLSSTERGEEQWWEKGILKRRTEGRYLQPRIPMLSLALMWDNSSCRETGKSLGDLFYSHTNTPILIQIFILTHTHLSLSACAHTLTLSMDASLRNSIRSSLSLLWFSSNTSEIHTQAR